MLISLVLQKVACEKLEFFFNFQGILKLMVKTEATIRLVNEFRKGTIEPKKVKREKQN